MRRYWVLATAGLLTCLALPSVQAAEDAIQGVASGKVQKVGFRAMILKQAIQYNLAGSARNTNVETVQFSLQGKPARLHNTENRIKQGTDKSEDVKVAIQPAKFDAQLRTFTVFGWTSTSRDISKPYDLVFTLRDDGSKVSSKQAKKAFCDILAKTLDAADWQKAKPGCDKHQDEAVED
ncbi:acylphosphatase [Chromobacterium sp. IIBBL 290-4]|uniref:acylphosphatase n=1 Tax=Chromobacterium sp. IIBBL 290-4 TaxID=2953890 RepID=UPI0020B7642B|nr:acylphosphatase [Chromobacterium sp. IIBBL 290-4]UTH73652.1 acylphosphatase [Chromobacterium sp. IIBBL 290-4]